MDYLTFRSRAIQALTIIPKKQKKIMSKDEIENWVEREYHRHYGNQSLHPITADIRLANARPN